MIVTFPGRSVKFTVYVGLYFSFDLALALIWQNGTSFNRGGGHLNIKVTSRPICAYRRSKTGGIWCRILLEKRGSLGVESPQNYSFGVNFPKKGVIWVKFVWLTALFLAEN